MLPEKRLSYKQAIQWKEESIDYLNNKQAFEKGIATAQKAKDAFYQLEEWEEYVFITAIIIEKWCLGLGRKATDQPEELLKETVQIAQDKKVPFFSLAMEDLHHAGVFVYFNKGDSFQAWHFASECVRISDKINPPDHDNRANAYIHLALTNSRIGNFAAAEAYSSKSIEIFQRTHNLPELFQAYSNQLSLFYDVGELDKAIILVKKMEKLLEQHSEKTLQVKWVVYNNIGSIFLEMGNHELDLQYKQKALRLIQKTHGSDHVNMIPILHNLNYSILEHNNPKKFPEALEFLEKASKIITLFPQRNEKIIAEHHRALAEYYFKIKNYSQALHYYQEVHKAHIVLHSEGHPFLIYLDRKIAYISYQQGKKDACHQLLKQSLSVQKEKLGKKHLQLTHSYFYLIDYYLLEKDTVQSQHFIEQVEALFAQLQQDKASRKSLLSLQSQLLKLKGRHYLISYQKTEDTTDILQSVKAFKADIELINTQKSEQKAEISQLLIGSAATAIFPNAIKAAYQACLKDNTVLSSAFDFIEQSKGSVLNNVIKDNLAMAASAIPKALQKQEQSLKKEIDLIEKKIDLLQIKITRSPNKLSKQFLYELQELFFQKKKQYHQLKEQLEKDYPNYYLLKYRKDNVSIQQVKEQLQENQALVNYFIGETQIFLFLITQQKTQFIAVEKPANFKKLVQKFVKAINTFRVKPYTDIGYQLYQLLIQPIEALVKQLKEVSPDLPHLIVIAHDVLHYLPFEALLCSPNSDNNYTKMDYLIHHYHVTYNYSSSLWLHLFNKKRQQQAVEGFVGFAPIYDQLESLKTKEGASFPQEQSYNDPFRSSISTLENLPHTETELRNIDQLFQEKNIPSKTFYRSDASKTNFKQEISTAKYILIAAHGIIRKEQNVLSGLLFHPADGSTISETTQSEDKQLQEIVQKNSSISLKDLPSADYLLSIKETYYLSLNADLVVMSSCESAIGQLQQGEGMMALNRGLFYTGANNIISTLFKVYDKPSSELTQYLFEYILQGQGYASALRQAKLQLIARAEVAPKSWCGFVLFGV